MRYVAMRRYHLIVFVLSVVLLGCTKMIIVDADTYIQNQAYYEEKYVLIKADPEDILEQYKLYKGKNIELTAPVTYYGDWGFSEWYLTLEKEGKKIRCYEESYRYHLPWRALYLVRWAKSEGGEVTARGKLRKDGIELYELAYKGLIVNTNNVPIGYDHNYDWSSSWHYLYR